MTTLPDARRCARSRATSRARTRATATLVLAAGLSLSACSMGTQSGPGSTTASVTAGSAGSAGSAASSSAQAGAPTSSTSSSTSAGPSSTTPSAADAWNATQKRLNEYTSLRVKADGDNEGKKISINVFGTVDGKTQNMDVSMGSASMTLRTVGRTNYVKANKAFYDSEVGQPGVSTLAADRWIEMSDDSLTGSEDKFALKSLISELTNDSSADSLRLESPESTVIADKINGRDVWKIIGADKVTTVWASSDGTYDLLKYSGSDDSGKPVTMTFSDHNKPVDIKAPSGALTLPDSGSGRSSTSRTTRG